mgnify:CR=1 FL=1
MSSTSVVCAAALAGWVLVRPLLRRGELDYLEHVSEAAEADWFSVAVSTLPALS